MADVISLANVRANAATYGWLTPLVVSIDAITAESLAPFADKDPQHDPYQVEDHLEEITRLLDNCLAYRREIYELQGMATKTALEYELFSKQFDALKKLDRADGIRKQLDAQRPHESDATTAFTDAGYKAMARATLAGLVSQTDWETTRTALVDTKWQMLDQYQRALNARHSEPGNALNYVERFNRVLAFYKDDITQAFVLSRAASAGLSLLSGIKAELPPVNTVNYLDKLIQWNRAVIKQYNLFRRTDLQCEITIPIRYLPSLKTDYVAQMKEEGNGELIFDLTDYFPEGMKYMRLKGVALTFSTASPETQNLRFQQVSALVVPPLSVDPFGSLPTTKTIPRNPLFVEATIGDKTIPVKYVSGPNLNNVAPDGPWSIVVSKRMLVADEKDRPKRSETRVANVELHLLLTTQMQSVAAGFKDFRI